jgi:hypothetical protein
LRGESKYGCLWSIGNEIIAVDALSVSTATSTAA